MKRSPKEGFRGRGMYKRVQKGGRERETEEGYFVFGKERRISGLKELKKFEEKKLTGTVNESRQFA